MSGKIYFAGVEYGCHFTLADGRMCFREATTGMINGKQYCWQHDPARLAAIKGGRHKTKKQEREERWQKKNGPDRDGNN